MSNNNDIFKLTGQQVLIKMVLDAQDNITRLVRMQEAQMVYIEELMSKVRNGSIDNKKENGNEQKEQKQDSSSSNSSSTDNQFTNPQSLT